MCGENEKEPKIMYVVADGLMPPGRVYGVFDTEEKAKEAIKEHDPYDSFKMYVEELELNNWIEYGWDV